MFGLPFSAVINQVQNLAMLAGGVLVAKGIVSSDQLVAIVGGFVALTTAAANYGTHQQALDATPADHAPTPAAIAQQAAFKPPLSAG